MVIDDLRDILIRIRFFSICILVAVVIVAAQQFTNNLNRMNNRHAFDALDPGLFQRALQAGSAERTDVPTRDS